MKNIYDCVENSKCDGYCDTCPLNKGVKRSKMNYRKVDIDLLWVMYTDSGNKIERKHLFNAICDESDNSLRYMLSLFPSKYDQEVTSAYYKMVLRAVETYESTSIASFKTFLFNHTNEYLRLEINSEIKKINRVETEPLTLEREETITSPIDVHMDPVDSFYLDDDDEAPLMTWWKE